MTQLEHPSYKAPESHKPDGQSSHGGHSWLMMVCCIPMLIIAAVLVATNVVSASFLIYAFACLGMMFVMMRMMDHGGMKM